MHDLAVHPKMLGFAQGSWNSLASLLELRNPLVPRGEGYTYCKKSTAEEALWGHPRGPGWATSFFHEPQGNEVFPVKVTGLRIPSVLWSLPTNSR